jgi:drug/metabolite transporter (DMT)-like permease
MPDIRHPVDTRIALLMAFLCSLWGFTHVTTKLSAPDISEVMQGGLRSGLAAVLLFVWARVRGTPLFGRDGTLVAGIVAGLMFAGEFAFVFAGLARTGASRLVVFLYVAPCLTALGLHIFVPGERLRPLQWAGVGMAFAGILAAFGDSFTTAKASLTGDLFGVAAAALWAATTVFIRATRLANISAAKVLFYQLAVSGLLLPLLSMAMGEPGIVRFSAMAIACLAFQGIVVAFASYLAWFWLLTRYLGSQLAVFTFLTPLFGVAFGVVLLDEPVTGAFLVAVVLVGAGIAMVSRRG